ncbi:MAG: hypothetical protein J6W80_03565, partial [Kiritimatiellae bacterium]|nr:hypothetical protein [Kiritimatiellia bacterium]
LKDAENHWRDFVRHSAKNAAILVLYAFREIPCRLEEPLPCPGAAAGRRPNAENRGRLGECLKSCRD